MTRRTKLFKAFSMISVLVVLLMCAGAQAFAASMEKDLAQIEQTGANPLNSAPNNENEPREESASIDIAAIIAVLTGIYQDESWEAAESGQSIAELGAAAGVDPQGVIDALLTGIQAEIDAETAGGAITADEAALWLAAEKLSVAQFVNEPIELVDNCSDDDAFLYEFLALAGEQLEMTEEAVWSALESGQTLAQLVEEMGGDSQTLIDAALAEMLAEIDDGDDFDEFVALFAELSGMEEDAVWEALTSGETLAQLAQAQGVDPQTIIDAMGAEARAEIDSALADNVISAEEAQLLLNEVELEAAELVNEPIDFDAADPLDEAAALLVELTGMKEDAVWEALTSGQTLAQLAQAEGADPQTIIDAMGAEARA
ncbi:MAG: hypothetical protein GY859_38060, partial [Desulfobacterales bacterium]|nr:hypothetical protein [Desulfobacterales bacterium]